MSETRCPKCFKEGATWRHVEHCDGTVSVIDALKTTPCSICGEVGHRADECPMMSRRIQDIVDKMECPSCAALRSSLSAANEAREKAEGERDEARQSAIDSHADAVKAIARELKVRKDLEKAEEDYRLLDAGYKRMPEAYDKAFNASQKAEDNVNTLADSCAAVMRQRDDAVDRVGDAERELADEKHKVKNLEEYMLKGVAFRDELQAALCRGKERIEKFVAAIWSGKGHCPVCGSTPHSRHCELHRAQLVFSTTAPCPHQTEVERLRESEKRLKEAGPGAIAAIKERIRQKEAEGWTPEHDAQHSKGELSIAAACYALNKMPLYADHWWDEIRGWWPWHPDWDKREKHSRERSLAIAAALCMAELDRLAESRRRASGGEKRP